MGDGTNVGGVIPSPCGFGGGSGNSSFAKDISRGGMSFKREQEDEKYVING